MKESDRLKLIRILGMLGSEHPGERAAAALAAHRLVRQLRTAWGDLLNPPAPGGSGEVIRTVYEYGIDHARAAEARIRQLKSENERLTQELKKIKGRLQARAAQEQRLRSGHETLSG